MPQYLAPGVYVEEVPSGARPIAGLGTSTAGFVGVVANDVIMPPQPGKFQENGDPVRYILAEVNRSQLITSWVSFQKAFGDIQAANNVLAHAVYGFFNNGGTRCWVTRVEPGATPDDTNRALTDALNTFSAIDEIAIVAIPGAIDADVQNAILAHCGDEHLQDRFAILDGRRTKEDVKGGVSNSSYGAIYFPWIDVGERNADGNPIYIPPSGHIAGVYARVDAARGVHKAPANEVIRGAFDVEVLVSKADQASLNPQDINVIRTFDGSVTVWGARTLAGEEEPEWRYINARRLFLFLRESIDEGTRWVVFEPNTPALWARITRNVTAFLTNVWRDGALFGNTPQEAFYVRCNAETNPPEVRDLGQVVTEIGVALIKPAEFVIFRISQWAGPGR